MRIPWQAVRTRSASCQAQVGAQPRRGGCAEQLSCSLGSGLRGLAEPEAIAEGITDAEVDPVGLFGWLLGDLDTLGDEVVIRLAGVIDSEEQVTATRALAQQLAHLVGRLVIHVRAPDLFEEDRACRVARYGDGEPAHE